MKAFLFTLVATTLVATVLFSNGHPYASASEKANANTLRQLEAEFMKAAVEHGSQGYFPTMPTMPSRCRTEHPSSREK
jgi:hypothetical protein